MLPSHLIQRWRRLPARCHRLSGKSRAAGYRLRHPDCDASGRDGLHGQDRGAMPSTTITVAPSSWLVPSVIPPVVGFMYLALCQAGHLRASGSWNPRSPRDSRDCQGACICPAKRPVRAVCGIGINILAERHGDRVDAATASLMEGGVMSADVSTATDEKSASVLSETSADVPGGTVVVQLHRGNGRDECPYRLT